MLKRLLIAVCALSFFSLNAADSAVKLSSKMQEALKKQVAREQYSANLYLSFASYFDDIGLEGCTRFFFQQGEEEQGHAILFYKHMLDRGMKFNLSTVEGSTVMPTSPLDAFEKLLANEREVTRSIYELMVLAVEEKDYTSEAFLQPFLLMQVEEEKNAEDYVAILSMGPTDGALILGFDQKLAEQLEE